MLRDGFDVETHSTKLTFQGVPIVGIPDMLNTIWLGLDLDMVRPAGQPNFGLSALGVSSSSVGQCWPRTTTFGRSPMLRNSSATAPSCAGRTPALPP